MMSGHVTSCDTILWECLCVSIRIDKVQLSTQNWLSCQKKKKCLCDWISEIGWSSCSLKWAQSWRTCQPRYYLITLIFGWKTGVRCQLLYITSWFGCGALPKRNGSSNVVATRSGILRVAFLPECFSRIGRFTLHAVLPHVYGKFHG